MTPHLERIHANSDWLLPLALLLVMSWIVWKIYRRDSVELSRFWKVFLPGLRLAILLVLLWIYLQPQWITEKERKVNSRFLVFCDTSLSMTLPESLENDSPSRSQRLAKLWESSPVLQKLNQTHDLVFFALDSEARIVWSAEKGTLSNDFSDYPKQSSTQTSPKPLATPNENLYALPDWTKILTPRGKRSRQTDGIREWLLAHSDLPVSGILLCSDGVQNSGGDLSLLVETARKQGFPIFTLGFGSEETIENFRLAEMEAPARVLPLDPFVIRATVEGTGFHDGEISREITLDLFRKPIASATNASTANSTNSNFPAPPLSDSSKTETKEKEAKTTAPLATNENSTSEKSDVQPSDAPTTGAQPSATSQTPSENAAQELETLIASQNMLLAEAGKQFAVEFKVDPQPVGKYLYSLRIRPGDREQNLKDNSRECEVDVMDRKTRVLIFAGGPMREYQFLTAALYRDKSIETDVLLQSALPPEKSMPKNHEEEEILRKQIQQDATRILIRFPETREELFAYDCILAVDPNWKVLDANQIDWVEEWTARHGGGMIFIAGPVFMGMVGGWMDDPEMEKIRALCPVEFFERTSSLRQNTFTADEIWPLDWTQAGRETPCLQLDDQIAASERIWDEFPGVYGHFPTRNLRAGATALAFFSNPKTKVGKLPPILLATQFYGAGRSFYLGTGEFWRLRAMNPDYFTRFYLQIIRYATQGRTLQQSLRGRLMLEKRSFFPGDPIEVRAQLLTPTLHPLSSAECPEVEAEIFLPNGRIQPLRLNADKSNPGLYSGRCSILEEGKARIELPIADSAEKLVQRFEIVLSDLERDRPQKDSAFLDELARKTGGAAFKNSDDPNLSSLPDLLRDRTRTLVEFDSASPVVPPHILLYLIVALLSLEWLLRRLLKLA